ncbi:MAG: NUDIX hydrolase [Calditrichaeota bacterium]|nr:NUDIX hydrolase [Calditrichota bacterium]MBT7619215.1 NUDIX hydrolase [Calditrichota bacterium]MBT7787777.1 NUDIX hydrolase [Calditrichota bacterium]
MSDSWPPVTPRLTVDAIIRTPHGIVLIKRSYEPLGWAIPGGFVDVGETVEAAAIREAFEETGLSIIDLWLVGVYSDPERDPRFHTVSVVFGAFADSIPVGGDDAAEARIFEDSALPEQIAFDHRAILHDFFEKERIRTLRKS